LRIGARVTDNTRVLTSFSHASKFKRTISVKATIRFFGNHGFNTRDIAISYHGMPTGTGLPMVSGRTVGTSCTFSWIAERLTFFASKSTTRHKGTDFISTTFIIASTAYFNTSNQWIAL
jgi:hypothetical protein